MASDSWFLFAADLILLAHLVFVAFVVFGLVLIWLGKFLHWSWIRNLWFRIIHLAAIGFVVLESWLGMVCPLTRWEMELRQSAGGVTYSGSFIAHWVDRILYYQFPAWVFVVAYTAFAALVIGSWFWVKPRRFARHQTDR